MLNTAAATRTPRTPRRRLRAPAAWERAGAVSGVLAWSEKESCPATVPERQLRATLDIKPKQCWTIQTVIE